MSEQEENPLLRRSKDTYGPSVDSVLLEQYKLYVQSAENVSSRRIASIRYMLTISTALVALYGIQSATFGQGWWLIPLPFIGIASAFAWLQIIKSHRSLNAIKFDLIHKFERHLPAAPFEEEWAMAERGQGQAYKPTTDLEQILPIGFILMHLLLLVMIVLASVGSFDWTGSADGAREVEQIGHAETRN